MLNLVHLVLALGAAAPLPANVPTAAPAPAVAPRSGAGILESLTGEQLEALRRRGEITLRPARLPEEQRQMAFSLAGGTRTLWVRLGERGGAPSLVLGTGRGAREQVLAVRALPALSCRW